ncbi:MAG TPA: cupredoxin domain-containing protein [Candidatus Eisenbacteria bacterium]|jgi:plastocyanin domain-containing protein
MKRMIFSLLVTLLVGSGALVLGACQQSRSGQTGGEVHIDVTDKGFEPAEVKVPAGQAVTLIMTRKTDQTCAKEVEFASLNQKYALPLNQAVRITLPASEAGTLSYQCGMHMLGGRVVIQ